MTRSLPGPASTAPDPAIGGLVPGKARTSSASTRRADRTVTRRRRRWLRGTCRWFGFLLTVPVAGASVLRALPVDWPVLMVQALSFMPWLVIPALAAVLLSFPGQSRLLQVLAGALLVAQVFWLFPGDIARPVAGPAGHSHVAIVAMTVNAELGGADAAEIARLARENHVDLLFIQEYNHTLADRLAAEGLGSLLPSLVSHPRNGAAGSAVYSTFRLTEVELVPGTPFSMPVVRLNLDGAAGGGGLTVVNVHTHAPVDDAVAQWRSDLSAAATAASRTGPRPVLLAGDFNATYDHHEFRALLQRGSSSGKLVDVAASLGSRLIPTWPMRVYRLPGVTLDHFITSEDIAGSGYSVHRIKGTDHAAVIATLAVPLS